MIVYQEGDRILSKIENLIQQIDEAGVDGEVIVVLDGVGSHSNELSEMVLGVAHSDSRVQVVTLSRNCGKAMALNQGVRNAEHDILVFADVRQTWDRDALVNLLAGFRDPKIGAVSGELVLHKNGGETAGVGLYWRYEKWLRLLESKYDSVIGVTGAICAVRRELFAELPAGTILDDVYWPLRVIMLGYRVKHEPSAIAFDQLPTNARDELRRKIRTLSGNYQLACRLPSALVPWQNRTWWQFISHKLLRLAVPWALLGAFVSSYLVATPTFRNLFYIQAVVYVGIVLGMWTGLAYKNRVSAAAAAFLLLNFAAWLAFWVWLFGWEEKSWKTVDYNQNGDAKIETVVPH